MHIPFCTHRCAYCDFNTYAGIENLIPAYTRALCREIELVVAACPHRLSVHTIFFGGGTPSLLPSEELGTILNTIQRNFDLQPGVEVTVEANPGTVSMDSLYAIRRSGVNRLSLGFQSANYEELRLLERQHSPEQVVQAVRAARRAGIKNLNLDLIFGLPYQSLDSWLRTLEVALALRPDHLSLYALTLEHGTPMENWVRRGLLDEPDPDLAADMYEAASERLERGGFLQYEISNWKRKGDDGKDFACLHNLQYWRNQPYLGFGAGAHGYAGGMRTANVLAPAAYIQRCLQGEKLSFPRSPATVEATPIDRQAEIAETMMMGLRLVEEGVSRQAFRDRFGEDLEERFSKEIASLIEKGLLEWQGDRLRLTKRGRLLGNQVFVEFI